MNRRMDVSNYDATADFCAHVAHVKVRARDRPTDDVYVEVSDVISGCVAGDASVSTRISGRGRAKHQRTGIDQ